MSIKSTSERKRQCASSATKTTNEACPPIETILAAVEHPQAECSSANAVFQHLLNCRECRAALTFVCASVAFEFDQKREKALWHQLYARLSKSLASGNNSSKEEYFDAIAAETPTNLIIQSSVSENDIHFWRATMTFPDVDQSEASLTIRVDDANGNPIPHGQFIIFGIEIPISDGMGQMTRTQFSDFHSKGGAAFRWQDGSVVSGAPVLNI